MMVVLAACGGRERSTSRPIDPPDVEQRDLTVDGLARRYRLFTPPRLDTRRPAPLVLALHGGGNTGESLVGATQLDRAAADNGFMVAFPEGERQGWDAGFCCTARRTTRVDEVRFLVTVLDDIMALRRVDTSRVYAVGVSNGAVMAYRLGCDQAGRITGVGSVAGAMIPDDCKPARPVSVIEVHGTADPRVPYEGGEVTPRGVANQPAPPTRAVVEHWARRDRCQAPPIEEEGVVRTVTWNECEARTKVRLVAVEGGRHVWFASEFGPVDGAVDATSVILDFFGLRRASAE